MYYTIIGRLFSTDFTNLIVQEFVLATEGTEFTEQRRKKYINLGALCVLCGKKFP